MAEILAHNLQVEEILAHNLQVEHNFINEKDNLKDIYKIKEEKETKNKDEKDNNKCKYCDKVFVKIYGLNRHLKSCNVKNDITIKLKRENEELKNDQKIKDDLIIKLKIENE